jgi:hypothetical protein
VQGENDEATGELLFAKGRRAVRTSHTNEVCNEQGDSGIKPPLHSLLGVRLKNDTFPVLADSFTDDTFYFSDSGDEQNDSLCFGEAGTASPCGRFFESATTSDPFCYDNTPYDPRDPFYDCGNTCDQCL